MYVVSLFLIISDMWITKLGFDLGWLESNYFTVMYGQAIHSLLLVVIVSGVMAMQKIKQFEWMPVPFFIWFNVVWINAIQSLVQNSMI